MTSRKLRRTLEHQARKAARKAGFAMQTLPLPQQPQLQQQQEQSTVPAEESSVVITVAPPSPMQQEDNTITPAAELSPRQIANRANSLLSTGAKTPETKAICALNHTIHGLARHDNGVFNLLTSEDPNGFEALKQSLIAEHSPSAETEGILVADMAESRWLAQRAQRLQDSCMNPDTGDITDEKKFSLYMRYQTTHTRAFHKSLNDLLKLRAEKRKAEIGFEAQRTKNEQNGRRKELHAAAILLKDAQLRNQIGANTTQFLKGTNELRNFAKHYEADLAEQGYVSPKKEAQTQAA